MMKHILFVITSFRHGGTNKSLENLLSVIDSERYQMDVFAMEHFGPYKQMLPNCTILPEDKLLSALISNFADSKGWAKVRSLGVKLWRNITGYVYSKPEYYLYKKNISRLAQGKKYDVIIAYSEGVPTAFVSHLNHNNKIAWIHSDYSSYMKLNNNPDESKIYGSFNSIVCVSEYTKNEFCKIMPGFNNKTSFIHNILNMDVIRTKSAERPVDGIFSSDRFTILTIGTFYAIKRLSSIPNIAKELLKRGCDFTWYVIATKGTQDELRVFNNRIKEFDISDFVVFLGEKNNPYSYLAHSDLFVSLSVTEACPYVINESKSLHIPIVCTDFPSAPEFVESGEIGYITPLDKIVDKIELLIKDKIVYQNIKSKSNEYSYDNMILMNKFYDLINN